MKAFVFLVTFVLGGCAVSRLPPRPTPADTVPKPATFEFAILSAKESRDDSYAEFLRKNTGAARIVQVSDGGAFGGSYFFTLADAMLTVESFEQERHRKESKRLSPEVAAAAWAEIGKLNIPGWRRRYDPEDITPGMQIFDGTRWSVNFCDATTEAYSSGNNVYPALSPLGVPTLDTASAPNAYRVLLAVLRNLTAGAKADGSGGVR